MKTYTITEEKKIIKISLTKDEIMYLLEKAESACEDNPNIKIKGKIQVAINPKCLNKPDGDPVYIELSTSMHGIEWRVDMYI